MLMTMMLAVLAAGTQQLTEYQRDPIGLYDANGDLVRKVHTNALPKPPFQTTGQAGDLYSGQDEKGQTVFFRSSDVVVTGKPPSCIQVAQAARSARETVAGASVGVSSNMGSSSVACVPAP